MDTTLVTFNCKSLKRSMDGVRTLCRSADIVALQETWLMPFDVPLLGTIDPDFGYTGTSAVDTSTGILLGRPFGGVALLWRKSVFKTVSVVSCDNVRLSAVKIVLSHRSILVFSVYMPTNSAENLSEFTECLSRINAIIEEQQVEACFILGDFNAQLGELFGNELQQFCLEQNWKCADVQMLGTSSDTFTFISEAHNCKRWLDHCVVTESACSAIVNVSVKYDMLWSDHFPLVISCNFNVIKPKTFLKHIRDNKVIWGNRHEEQLVKYNKLCNDKLRLIDFPDQFRLCADSSCHNLEHRAVIDNMYQCVISILSNAACHTYEKPRCNRKGGYVRGWNRHVSESHREARLSFQLWLEAGKPLGGQLYRNMVESRKNFKSKLKWCQDNQEQIVMDKIACLHSNNNFKNFWQSTKNLNHRSSVPVSVDGLTDMAEISNLFKDLFTVKSPLGPSCGEGELDRTLTQDLSIRFTAKEVKDVIVRMKRGKSPGHDGLSVEHLKHAGIHLPRVLALFINCCLSHAYLPRDMMRTIVVPIVKNRTSDISDKGNYRPISLATIVAKVFDALLDKVLKINIKLHDAQHGFREGLSTETAVLCLKKTVNYYTGNQTPVFACFLDMSKAFDMVSYTKLWPKLCGANVPSEVINIFKYWYSHQLNCVRWANVLSEEYAMECGVRQGGLTSPTLFNLYINDLIVELSSLHAGCYIDGVAFNNISYADDMALLSPSMVGLRKLIRVCECYAEGHGLRYNSVKSELMVFGAANKVTESYPAVFLSGCVLNRVRQFKYLGHIVTDDLRDNLDVDRERRALAVRCNMLIRRFSRCTGSVKITLFKAYCQVFYTCSLWSSFTLKAVNALRVQYNNAFRMLLGLPRFCSASGMFVDARIDSFAAIRRKRAASLLHRVRAGNNSLLSVIANKLDCPFIWYLCQLHVPIGNVY